MSAHAGYDHPALSGSIGDTHGISTLPILVLAVHSRCNCRCVMCDIWKRAESESLGTTRLASQIEALKRLGVEWVVFSGGEPLMSSSVFELGRLLKQQGVRLTLLSTGLLLSKRAADVVAVFDDVIVSLDGPAKIHDSIRRVHKAYKSLSEGVDALLRIDPAFRVHARTTVQSANHSHLRATVDAARSIGLSSISFLAADVSSTAFNRGLIWPVSRQFEVALTSNEVAALEEEIETLIVEYSAEMDTGYIVEPPAKLRRIVSHFRAQLGLETPVSPACNAPWVSAVVESDGAVRPCFFQPAIGHLDDGPLDRVLNSSHALAFRSTLDIATNPICQRCVCSLHYKSQHGEKHATGTR